MKGPAENHAAVLCTFNTALMIKLNNENAILSVSVANQLQRHLTRTVSDQDLQSPLTCSNLRLRLATIGYARAQRMRREANGFSFVATQPANKELLRPPYSDSTHAVEQVLSAFECQQKLEHSAKHAIKMAQLCLGFINDGHR